MSIKIIITDDHPLIINGLENMLRHYPDMQVIAKYNNGKALLAALDNEQPDILILDIHMPGQTGDELARIVTQQYPRIRMIALTNLDNIYYIKSMLQHGVLGYILKNTEEEMLVQAIHAVYKGEQFLDPTIKNRVQQDKISTSKQAAHGTILTRREKDVLELIANNYTSQEIAEKLFLSKRTIDSHRLNLLLKLEVKNAASLVKKAIEMGLI